jgi:DNA adenine methylase
MQSPLRYPGGKSDFVATVDKILRATNLNGMPLCEPYAGSAAVSLGLLSAGTVKNATILERDPLLFSFWKCVFEKTDELVTRFKDLPITLETWHNLQPLFKVNDPMDTNILDLGVAGLFFNRANFSGILNGGPIGGKDQASQYKIDCRTNKDDLIKRLISIAKLSNQVSVEYGDAIDFIVRHKRRRKEFFYIDPPYFEKGNKLYRHYYKLSDHKKLAEVLRKVKFPWILSYDSHHVIEFFYEDFNIRKHNFRYSVRSPRNDEELLISNFDLPENLENWR